MAPKYSPLATYIESIHYGDDFPYSRGPIFDYGITHPSPTLRSDRINSILVYPGSFNPPHRGHFELLRHGFMKSGRDMNIIAAVVLPLDDESLVKKLIGHKSPLIFTKAERIRLWNGYGRSDWYWTYDRSTDEWFESQRRISKTISKDGFDISWTMLCGPDYVQIHQVPQIPVWGCKDIIISDAGRAADFTPCAVKRLTSLNGCGTWGEMVLDFQTPQTYAQEAVSWMFSGAFMISPQSTQQMLGKGGCK